jgi:hypothetical protein
MADPEVLREAERIIAYVEETTRRASELAKDRPARSACFLIVGLQVPAATQILEAELRPLVNSPGEMTLARALRRSSMFGAIGRWSSLARCELDVGTELAGDSRSALEWGWTIAAALRMRLGSAFLVPAVADRSWDTIAAADDNSCDVRPLEDAPLSLSTSEFVAEFREVMAEDASWVEQHIIPILRARADARFQFALESMSSSFVESDRRMAVAKLWAGIESLFDVSQELTFRLSLLVAALLEPPGQARYDCYRHVRALYSIRSRVVHGGRVTDTELRQHISETRTLLSRCLVEMASAETMPQRIDLEKLLCGVPLAVEVHGQES